jgi:hypothetical protein
MRCEDNRLLHSGLLDGELAPDERARVQAHLVTCAECTAELAALARTLGMLHALPSARAPLGFVNRVIEAARPTPWHRRLERRLFRPLRVKLPLEAAAVLLVALGAVYVFQNTPELQQAARDEQSAPAPVPVAPPATPLPPTDPGATGTPAPSPSAPAEPPRRALEVDQAEKNKEREGALPDTPATAVAPPAGTAAKTESRSAAKKDARMTRTTKPPGRTDSPDAARGAANVMKDAAPGPAPVAAPAPSAAPPGVAPAPPTIAPPPSAAAPSAVAPPAAPAPAAREKSVAAPRPQSPRETEGVRAESKPGELSTRARQVPAHLFVAPDAAGRLTVGDRAAADRALGDLGARLGVAQAFRREEPDGTIIEWIVPREVYADFVRGLAGVGRWTADREPATLPARVRLQVRVGS